MKAEVSDLLETRAVRAKRIRQLLIEVDNRFSETQARDISALFDQFPGYRWNKGQENLLRTKLYEILQPVVGAAKMIELANRIFSAQE